jgi:hypothetical protein
MAPGQPTVDKADKTLGIANPQTAAILACAVSLPRRIRLKISASSILGMLDPKHDFALQNA